MVEFDLSSLFARKWAPYTIAGLTSAVLVYQTVFPYSPRKRILKGLSHAGNQTTSENLRRAFEEYPESFHGPGEYAHFPDGSVKYWLVGPPDGQRVVLVHGLSTPSLIFRPVADILAKNGFRVLLYDLYGRGYSDCPPPPFTAELYIIQLALLMQKVGWDKADIVGLSMGGGITAAFASTFPHLVNGKLCFIASAGAMEPRSWRKLHTSWQVRLAKLRFVSSFKTMERSIVPLQAALLPGYTHAIASSLIEGPIWGIEPAFKKIGKSKVDVFLIWGTEDTVVHLKHSRILEKLMPQAKAHIIEGAGHDLTLTIPDQVASALMDFLSGTLIDVSAN